MKKKVFFRSMCMLTGILFFFAVPVGAQSKYVMLNHVAFDVTNLQNSYKFYTSILKLDSISEPFHDGRHKWFKIGEHSQLHLIEVKTETAVHYKGTHICFTVPSIEVVIDELNAHNIHFENWLGKESSITLRPDGVKQIYFQDPDGYWIEVNNDRF